MGFKPIPTAKWKKWLKSLGLEYKRTEGSHEVWDYPNDSLLRPVVFRGAKKRNPRRSYSYQSPNFEYRLQNISKANPEILIVSIRR